MLDFRRVIMDIEKKIVKIMTHTNQNIPTEINRIVSGSELKQVQFSRILLLIPKENQKEHKLFHDVMKEN